MIEKIAVWGVLVAVIAVVVFQLLFNSLKGRTAKVPKESVESLENHVNSKSTASNSVKEKNQRISKSHRSHHHIHHKLDLNTIKGHGDAVTGIAFSSDGKGLATVCGDRVIRVFHLNDVASKSFKFLRINLQTGKSPTAVAFGNSSANVVVTCGDALGASLFMYTSSNEAPPSGAQVKPKAPELSWEQTGIHGRLGILTLVSARCTHGNGNGSSILASCSEGTDIKLWSASDGKCVGSVDTNQLKNTMAALSPDARFLSAAAFTADVKIWEVVYGKDGSVKEVVKVMQLKGHKSAVTWLCFTADSQKMVTASKDGSLKLWNINVRYQVDEDPRCLKTFQVLEVPNSKVLRAKANPHYDIIAISPNEKILAASIGKSILWISMETGELMDCAESAHEDAITCLVWAPSKASTVFGPSMILASSSLDKKIKLWAEPGLNN